MRRPSIVLACLTALGAGLSTAPAVAGEGRWLLGVHAGVRDGSEVAARPFGQDDDLDLGLTYGLSLARELRPETAVEVTWLHDEPSFVIEDEPGGGSFEVRIDTLDVAGVYRPTRPSGRRPFVSAALGLVRYAASRSGFDDDLRLAFTVGGGTAWPVTERSAIRLTARGRLVFGDATLAGVCGGVGCLITVQADGQFQLEGDVSWLVRW